MNAIRSWLFIGAYRDTTNYAALQSQKIDALLSFAEPVEHRGIVCRYLLVDDGVPLDINTLQTGLAFIHDHYRNNQRVLIACGAGVSRSATFAIAALKEIEQTSLLEAARIVHDARPSVMPHHLLWDALCTYYNEPAPYLTLVQTFNSRARNRV